MIRIKSQLWKILSDNLVRMCIITHIHNEASTVRPQGTIQAHITHASGKRKTVCTSAVLAHFGIMPNEYNYSGQWGDIERILRRKGYAVRSRKSACKSATTIGKLRQAIRMLDDPNAVYYVGVNGHAMLLNSEGTTIVDTAPRQRDKRKVTRIYAVFRKH